jgi:enoyl-CoA hydratase/carnithine racemase
MSEIVSYVVQGHLGVITLNNPPVNALAVSKGVLQRILDAIKEGEHDTAVRAFLIMGGGRAFSGGADISEFGQQQPVGLATLPALANYMDTVTKPIVAGIHGFALGGGLELALACHYRCAVAGAQLGLPEVKLGLLPGAGGTQRLPRLIGPARAKKLVYTGQPIDAEEALRIGLVDRVVPDGEVYDAASRMAAQFCAGPAQALRAAKQAIDAGLGLDLDAGLGIERAHFSALFGTEDQTIGMRSFVENGPGKARFVGR